AVRAGAQDYLVKGDLPPQRVCQSVSKALERHAHLKNLSTEALDLRKKNNSLRELVQIDPLTGLFNRRGFQKALARPSQTAELFQASCAMQIGLDDFKKVNDLYGYSSGNEALKEIGHRIRKLLRPGDIAARIGGDEFLVFLPSTHLAESKELGERIRRAVVGTSLPGDFKVTVSVGVTVLPKRACTIDEILERTHRVLRMSKGAGKNRVALSGELPDAEFGPNRPGPARTPFFCLKSGRLAGYAFEFPDWADEPAGLDPLEGADGQVAALVRSAVEQGAGLECHLHLSHAQLLRLRPEHLSNGAAPDLEPRRLRLAVPEIPMSPIPPGLLDAIRHLQSAGWAFALHGLDLGPHSWASLILLEPAVV
ncbi:MAG TPA: GGDEF domain-containing protein, partial [bacterium]|nr:GGDEF domain-containing protein [bacterium]